MRAEFERVLQVGAREGVVDHERQPLAACDLTAQAAMSIMRSMGFVGLSIQSIFVSESMACLDFIENGRIDEREADSEAGHHLREEAVAAPVEIVANDDVIPRR